MAGSEERPDDEGDDAGRHNARLDAIEAELAALKEHLHLIARRLEAQSPGPSAARASAWEPVDEPHRATASRSPEPGPPAAPVPVAAAQPPTAPAPAPEPTHITPKAPWTADRIEELVGSNVLSRTGIVVFVLGVVFFLNHAYQAQWISVPVRLAGSLALSVGLMLAADKMLRSGKQGHVFPQSMFAGGAAIAYYTIHLSRALTQPGDAFDVTVTMAAGGMVLVVLGMGAYAIWRDTKSLVYLASVLTLITAFYTGGPAWLDQAYVVLMSAATLFAATMRDWKPNAYVAVAAGFVGLLIVPAAWPWPTHLVAAWFLLGAAVAASMKREVPGLGAGALVATFVVGAGSLTTHLALAWHVLLVLIPWLVMWVHPNARDATWTGAIAIFVGWMNAILLVLFQSQHDLFLLVGLVATLGSARWLLRDRRIEGSLLVLVTAALLLVAHAIMVRTSSRAGDLHTLWLHFGARGSDPLFDFASAHATVIGSFALITWALFLTKRFGRAQAEDATWARIAAHPLDARVGLAAMTYLAPWPPLMLLVTSFPMMSDWDGPVTLGLGLLAAATVARVRAPVEIRAGWAVAAAVLILFWPIVQFEAAGKSIAWAMLLIVGLILQATLRTRVIRFASSAAAIFAAVHLVAIDARSIQPSDPFVLESLAFLLAAVGYVGAYVMFAARREEPSALGRLGLAAGLLAPILWLSVAIDNRFITIAWAGLGVLITVAGFMTRLRDVRVGGLAIFALVLIRVFLVELARLETVWRVVTFMAVGALLIGISFAYSRKQRAGRDEPPETASPPEMPQPSGAGAREPEPPAKG